MGNQQTQGLSAEEILSRENIKSLDWETKQKLSSSHVKYNLRIIIKGDRNTGKTCLWRRLQGLPYVEAYTPTPEIQVCNIHWSYKNTDDLIKIEIWDVVDKAKRKKKDGLKVEDSSSDEETAPTIPNVDASSKTTGNFTVQRLDATTVDVYKGTHGVIIMMDPTKKWTFEYAQREIEKVPKDVYVLLLVNYRDMGEYRVISENDIREWVKFQEHPNVKYLDASMKNSFGLKSIITFFNLPFLKLQRNYIEQQLKLNSEEILNVEKEIELVSKEQSYEFYVKWLEQTKKTKGGKGVTSNPNSGPSSPVNNSSIISSKSNILTQSAPNLPNTNNNNILKQPSLETITTNTPTTPPTTSPTTTPPTRMASVPNIALSKSPQNTTVATPQTTTTASKSPAINNNTTAVNATNATITPKSSGGGGGGFFSKLMSRVSGNPQQQETQVDSKKDLASLKEMAASKKGPTQNIDDFAIGTLDEDFLSDNSTSIGGGGVSSVSKKQDSDEEDDDERVNPMVIQDEDLDDLPTPVVNIKRPNINITTTQKITPTLTTTAAAITSKKNEPPSNNTKSVAPKTAAVVKDASYSEESDTDLPNPLVSRKEEEEEEEDNNEDDWGSPSVSHFNAELHINKDNEEEEEEDETPNPLVSREDEEEEEEEEEEPEPVVIKQQQQQTSSLPVNIKQAIDNNNSSNKESTSIGSNNSAKISGSPATINTPPPQTKAVVMSPPKTITRPIVTPIPDDDEDDTPNPLVSKFYDDDEEEESFSSPNIVATSFVSDNGVSLGYEDFEDLGEGGFDSVEEPQLKAQPAKKTTKSKVTSTNTSASGAPKKKMKSKPVNETPEEREERKRRHKLKKTSQKKSSQQQQQQQPEEEEEEEWI